MLNKLASAFSCLTTNSKGDDSPVELNASNIATYVEDSDFNNINDLKIYFLSNVTASHSPIERMYGTFISFPYKKGQEYGNFQIYINNQTNDFYFRASRGSIANPQWQNWSKIMTEQNQPLLLKSQLTNQIINSSNAETYFPTLDMNDIYDMKVYYFYHCNTLDNSPVDDLYGLFYSINFYDNETGVLQYYIHSQTNEIYYRTSYGSSQNVTWQSWKKIETQMQDLKSSLNTKTYRIMRKVLCVGDSFTSGHISEGGVTSNSNEYYAWTHYMETNGNVYVNCGISGANSSTWLTNENGLAKAQATGHVQAYIIGLGINDASSDPLRHIDVGTSSDIGTDNNTYYANISKIVRELSEISPLAKILMLTRPQCTSEYNSSYNEAIRDIVEAYENDYNVILVDLYEDYNELFTNASLTGDYNGHYSAMGYEQFAEILSYCFSDVINNNISKFRDIHTIPIT